MIMKLLNGKENGSIAATNPSGIGIQNVQKRLDLLYPGQHELSIKDEEDVFIVNLKITLVQKKETITQTTAAAEPVYA